MRSELRIPNIANSTASTPLSMMFCSKHYEDEEVLATIARKVIENCDQDRNLSLDQFRLALQCGHTSTPSHRQFSIFQSHLMWEMVSLNDRLDMLVAGFHSLRSASAETLDAWIGRDNWKRVWSECSPKRCRKLLDLMSRQLGTLGYDGFDNYNESWKNIFSHLLKHLINSE